MTMESPLAAQKRVLNNTLVLSSAEVVAQLANFAFVVGLARVYGREVLGLYAFAMAVGAMCAPFVSLGTHTLVLRELSREPDRTAQVTGALFGFQLCMALILILGVHLAARIFSTDPLLATIVTFVASFRVLMRAAHLLVLSYNARQEMGPSAAMQATSRLGILALGGLAMLQGAGPALALASLPIVALAALVSISLTVRRRFGGPLLRAQLTDVAAYVRRGLPYFLVVVTTVLHARLGIVYLTTLGSQAEAGLFASAERLVLVGTMPLMMFNAALLPVVARLWQRDRARFTELVQRAARLIVITTLPLATLLAVFARDVMRILYGNEFTGGATVLSVVAWILLIRGVAQLLSTTSVAANCQRALLAGRLLGLAVLTLSSVVVVPSFGAPGLAASLLLSEVSATTLNHVLLHRAGVPLMTFDGLFRVAPACLIAAGVASLINGLELWLRLPLVAGSGGAALWAFGAVRGHDLAYLRAILTTRDAR